jgi:hypothetical protein
MAAFIFFMILIAMLGLQLASGQIGMRGSTLKRDRNPKGFWIGIAFEIVVLLALAGGILSGLAR